MANLRKSAIYIYALSFSSFCPAAMFATSNDVPVVTFSLTDQNDIYEGYTFHLRAYFNGSIGAFHDWSLWPGYERCNNPDSTIVGAWSLAIPQKIITNGITLEIYGLSDGGGGIPSKMIDIGNGRKNMWVFWPYTRDSHPSGALVNCKNYVDGSKIGIGNGTMNLWATISDISADHKPGKYSIFVDSEASYNAYENNTNIINNEAFFRQVSLSNVNKKNFTAQLNFTTNSNCSVSDSELIFDHGMLNPNDINNSEIDKYIEISCSALYSQGRARLYFDNTIGSGHKDLKLKNNEINARITVDRTEVSILGGGKEKIKISSRLSKISNRVQAGAFSGSTVLTVEWY